MKPVSAGLAVTAISRSDPISRVISAHSSPVRWSAQMMEGLNTSPFSSSITRPCICPEMPMEAMSLGSTPLSLMTWLMVATAASHQSFGSCSAQPLCGWYSGYSAVFAQITPPSRLNSTVLVPEVPRSMPSKVFI